MTIRNKVTTFIDLCKKKISKIFNSVCFGRVMLCLATVLIIYIVKKFNVLESIKSYIQYNGFCNVFIFLIVILSLVTGVSFYLAKLKKVEFDNGVYKCSFILLSTTLAFISGSIPWRISEMIISWNINIFKEKNMNLFSSVKLRDLNITLLWMCIPLLPVIYYWVYSFMVDSSKKTNDKIKDLKPFIKTERMWNDFFEAIDFSQGQRKKIRKVKTNQIFILYWKTIDLLELYNGKFIPKIVSFILKNNKLIFGFFGMVFGVINVSPLVQSLGITNNILIRDLERSDVFIVVSIFVIYFFIILFFMVIYIELIIKFLIPYKKDLLILKTNLEKILTERNCKV